MRLYPKLKDCEHYIQFHIGLDHKECYFCKTCIQTILKIDFPDFKKENYSRNKITNNVEFEHVGAHDEPEEKAEYCYDDEDCGEDLADEAQDAVEDAAAEAAQAAAAAAVAAAAGGAVVGFRRRNGGAVVRAV